MRLCKDCKHYEFYPYVVTTPWHITSPHHCLATNDPVTGERVARYAHQLRKENSICGPDGKLWETKSSQSPEEWGVISIENTELVERVARWLEDYAVRALSSEGTDPTEEAKDLLKHIQGRE